MSCYVSPCCRNEFNKNKNKPIVLSRGDSMCSNCIEHMETALKNKFFECYVCNEKVSSTNIINKCIYNISKEKDNSNINNINKEFNIVIRHTDSHKIELLVTKYMTVKQLREKIAEKEHININNINLEYKKPLKDDKTLVQYEITKTVLITMLSTRDKQ